MKKVLTAYFSTLLAFLILDGIWLGLLMGSTYRDWLGPLMLAAPLLGPAVVFYLLYAAGLVIFGVLPALKAQRLGHATLYSGLLGLIAYGTYDLTNWATLQGWPAQLALVDLAWGTVVSALAGTAGYLATRRLA
ncbi:membrane protein [Pseudomonas cichorii]|uniref:DUF2177 family protein n=1 Tax=Pseudomonas serbiensis TaxID=3064350 RepID=A0ABT9CYT4_9PSED|nr:MULTISPECIES: DUF2177 family protein [Pseudomonas]MDO7929957.1 DUF2177 family protein [Pseudomonas sp. KFB-138]GFM79684.1 membrane protein [Pseudomonas cichorii]GFM85127.1 membrane protein [Pseudomonas cichorii]